MSRKFTIDPYWYGDDIKLYKKKSIEINPGVTVLIGCNGAGKTTLMEQMKKELKQADILYQSFDNLSQGGSTSRSAALHENDFAFFATGMCSSEGENIILNIGKQAQKIGDFVRRNQNEKELWLFFDAIDSGLSIDNVFEIKECLFDTIIQDCTSKNIQVYIIVAANSYEMAREEACFDVHKGKYRSFKTYEDYRNYIFESSIAKKTRATSGAVTF